VKLKNMFFSPVIFVPRYSSVLLVFFVKNKKLISFSRVRYSSLRVTNHAHVKINHAVLFIEYYDMSIVSLSQRLSM